MPPFQQEEFELQTQTAAPKSKGLERWEETTQKYREALEDPSTPTGIFQQRLIAGNLENAYACFEYSTLLIKLLHEQTPPHIAFVLNSSTGKDSTITCQALIAAVQQEIESGRGWTRPIAVAIADTGSEFPEMKNRMVLEAAALNKLGENWKIPLTAHIVKPEVKHRLLVELCGNGKPVPAVSTTGKTQGVSAWCMDRVKAGTLKKISQAMAELHGDYVPILGVRSAESSKRKLTMEEYAKALPQGLSKITTGTKTFTLVSTPVAHWPNKAVSDFIRAFPPPWRPEGREELRAIYFKGSPLEGDQNYHPSECSVSISDEGQISNSCSDLSGTRYGCWHCFLSSNKSLKNTARREPRYQWPKKFHNYLYQKGQEAIRRSSRLKKLGFVKEDSFSKTFTFLERYKMLMFLFRCEMESGLALLEPEEEVQIQKFWERHGVFCVNTADARLDAETWKKTGKWKAFFEDIQDESHRLCQILSEGFPFGAISGIQACEEETEETSEEEPEENLLELINEEDTPNQRTPKELEMVHLMAFAGHGFGTPPYPKLLAYVFQEQNKDGKSLVTVITDTPCLLGLPTNTGLLNGMIGIQWDCIGVREPIPWEKQAAKDRNFVYRTKEGQPLQESALKSCPELQRYERDYQNNLLLNGCGSDDPFKDHWFDLQLIESLKVMTNEEFHAVFSLTSELQITSETLTDYFNQKKREVRKTIDCYQDQLLEDSDNGRNARRTVRKLVRRDLDLEKIAPVMQYYAKGMKLAAKAIRLNMLNSSLLTKLLPIHQLLAIDPLEGEKQLKDLLLHIPLESRK